MGKVSIMSTGPLATLQDVGRPGYRKYGIPSSGAMDKEWMAWANRAVGNSEDFPVIELALGGMTLEVLEATELSVVGADMKVNGVKTTAAVTLMKDDKIEISQPSHNYAYVAIGGALEGRQDFGSISTYVMAGFGGLDGSPLKKGDVLLTQGSGTIDSLAKPMERDCQSAMVRIMKGPEWSSLKELPDRVTFKVDPSSDRMGIRLKGSTLLSDYKELASSAVIPGTVQLPASGEPIILMNDCQTTGGYPRIAKVLDEDLGKLAQVKPGGTVQLVTIET